MPNFKLIAEPGKQEILITCDFDAPRERVFQAYTDATLIPSWWGPARFVTTVERLEPRPGGLWHFIHRDTDGSEYGFHGVYHSVVAPEQLVYTFEFEGAPGHVLLETVTLEEQHGKTKLRAHAVFQSVADRDGMLHSGMERGAAESMERLAKYLEAGTAHVRS